jgi:phosphoinositide 3-/4-kinase-like protein
VSVSDDEALGLLASGEIEILGLLPYASNATLLTRVRSKSSEKLAVYKPRRGERPLWDFPDGTLCLREYAAWVVDQALGWQLVPPTVLREGPAGFGALQLFVEETDEFDVRELVGTHRDDLRRMAVFDVVVNNTDRKAGHLIVDRDAKLWGVDHGICFSAEPKLRTVIWAFEGEPIPAELLADVAKLRNDADAFRALGELLDPDEVEALCRRIEGISRSKRFPSPGSGYRSVPWPPW